MSELTPDDKRDLLVTSLLNEWNENKETPFFKKVWNSITKAMEFVGSYEGWSGADKKEEVLKILRVLLDKTDSAGPDFLVHPFIEMAAEWGIDSLYDAFKGKFAFDGKDS